MRIDFNKWSDDDLFFNYYNARGFINEEFFRNEISCKNLEKMGKYDEALHISDKVLLLVAKSLRNGSAVLRDNAGYGVSGVSCKVNNVAFNFPLRSCEVESIEGYMKDKPDFARIIADVSIGVLNLLYDSNGLDYTKGQYVLSSMEDALEKFIENRKGDYIKKNVLEKLDEQVDKTVKAYKTDWTVHDRDRVEDSAANSRFVCMLRDTGCDTMFLSGKYFDLGNLEYSSNAFKAHNSKKYLYYDGKKLLEIPKDKVKKLNEEAWKSLPQEYIDAYERKDESAQGSFDEWCAANKKTLKSFTR